MHDGSPRAGSAAGAVFGWYHEGMLGDVEDPTTAFVRRALGGDGRSLEWIVRRFSPLLRAQAAYRLGGEVARVVDPDDLVSEAWLVGLRKLPTLDLGDRRCTPAVLGYLAQVVRYLANNALRAHLRRQEREPAGFDEGEGGAAPVGQESTSIVRRAARREVSDRVEAALDTLDAQARAIVVLRGVEGLRNHEVAELLGALPTTISHRYQRALRTLRERIPESVFMDLVDS